jgi:hypothetical protein
MLPSGGWLGTGRIRKNEGVVHFNNVVQRFWFETVLYLCFYPNQGTQ